MTRLIAVVSLVLVASGMVSASNVNDPPRIVPWHQIGWAGIGMLKGAVEYRYGQSRDPVTGNKYSSSRYTVPGGTLQVMFTNNRVTQVSTTSARYTTPDGIGVGSVISLPPCLTVKGQCVRRWKGFTLAHDQSQTEWVKQLVYGARRLNVALMMGTYAAGQWRSIDKISSVYMWRTP